MRLEWAEDQWWAATQRQEYEKQASLESLLRTYVADHFDAIASDLQHGSPRHRRTMAMALGFSERQDAVPLLAESLKDQYYEVVLHSLLALYQLTKLDPTRGQDDARPEGADLRRPRNRRPVPAAPAPGSAQQRGAGPLEDPRPEPEPLDPARRRRRDRRRGSRDARPRGRGARHHRRSRGLPVHREGSRGSHPARAHPRRARASAA